MDNRLKDFFDEDDNKLVDLETDKEVEQIIRDAGIATAAKPSKKSQYSDAADESIKLARKRAEEIKYLRAKSRTKAKLNFFKYDRATKEFFINDVGSIRFLTENDNDTHYQHTIFEILFEYWKKSPFHVIPISTIIKEASRRLRKDLHDDWFKNNFRHLKSKIKRSRLSDYIFIEREKDSNGKTTGNISIEIVNPNQ